MANTWIFDFDGTLVHSEAAITQCFESITKKLAPHRLGVAKHVLIGPPLRQTVAEILGDPEHPLIDEFVSAFIRMHDDDVINNTTLYPNTYETLTNFHQQGQEMAIATNKRLVPTIKILQHFNLEKFFLIVECSDSEISTRSKSEMTETIIKKNNNFKNAFFIGDTTNDAIAANTHNMKFIKALYGYGKNQDWSSIKVFHEIEKIEDLIKI